MWSPTTFASGLTEMTRQQSTDRVADYHSFFAKKEELSDEFSSSHVADSSSTFAYLDYIMNFLKVNVRDLAKAKYEDTYLLTTFKLYHVF